MKNTIARMSDADVSPSTIRGAGGLSGVMERRLGAAARGLGPVVLAAMAGCAAVGPNYTPPSRDTAAKWTGLAEPSATATEGTADLYQWWTRFNDPALNSLVSRAIEKSPTLKVAAARVLEARALRGVAASDKLPSVDSRGGVSRSQSSENVGFPQPGVDYDPRTLYTVGLDAGWEIDLFGRVRRGVEAADADLAAAEWSRRDVMVTLVSEVCRNYAEYRGAQLRLEVIGRSVKVQEETLDVAAARAKAGIASDLEVMQATAQLETRRAQIPQIEIARRAALYRLGVLLGGDPASLGGELTASAPLPTLSAPIGAGVPSDLLRRRPDIRRAERELAGATARIGIATADLYPRVSLNGGLGFETNDIKSWPDWASRAWSIGPSFRWNIFDADRIRNNIRATDARAAASLAAWDDVVLGAFEEVENRLMEWNQQQRRRISLGNAVSANRRALELSNDLYKAGVRDFLNVLDSQRALYDTEDQLVLSEITLSTTAVALFKSLGGGWEEGPPAGEGVEGESAGEKATNSSQSASETPTGAKPQ